MPEFKIRPLTNQNLYNALSNEVPSGEFRFYKTSEVPAWIEKHGQYGECCVLVTATSVGSGLTFGELSPIGKVFTISYFRDDISYTKGQHFNKDSRTLFGDGSGNRYNLFFRDNQHLIPAFATGTSQPYLISSFQLPQRGSGLISELSPAHETLRFYDK